MTDIKGCNPLNQEDSHSETMKTSTVATEMDSPSTTTSLEARALRGDLSLMTETKRLAQAHTIPATTV